MKAIGEYLDEQKSEQIKIQEDCSEIQANLSSYRY